MKKYIMFALLIIVLPSSLSAQTYFKSNGIFDMWMNQYGYPIITRLDVVGNVVVPHDNAGADFSMTARSILGDAYNPTQGGDCNGAASSLSGVVTNWNSGYGIAASNGIQLSVDPLNYNEPGFVCGPTQPPMPMDFKFGVTLGDGVQLPKEVLVLDMEMKREAGAQDIVKRQSELPAIFPSNFSLKYAYYSTDGVNFLPWVYNGSNNIQNWAGAYLNSPNQYKFAKAIMLHTEANAVANPNTGMGFVIYTNDTVEMVMGKRAGSIWAHPGLGYMAALGSASASDLITDFNWHSWRRIVVTGTLNDIKNRIVAAKTKMGSGAWNW